MKRYWIKIAALMLLSVFLLTGTAFAEEVPGEVPEEELIVTLELVEPMDGSLTPDDDVWLLEGPASWSGTRYRDQLSAEGKTYYDAMERGFEFGNLANITDHPYAAYYELELPEANRTFQANQVNEKDAYVATLRTQYDPSVKAVYEAFRADHPALFWTLGSYYAGVLPGTAVWSYSDGTISHYEVKPKILIAYILPSEYVNGATRNSYTQKIDSVVEQILSECSGLSTLGKLAYFDNWLAVNNKYNGRALNAGSAAAYGNSRPWNVTSALLSDEQPVCEGYSKAFQLLCHKIGVPCVTVSSKGHMWNVVQLDTKWYYVDCTWDDPNEDENSFNYSTREHFLVSSFADSEHVISQSLVPPTVTSNYFADTPSWSLSGDKVSGYSKTINKSDNGQYWMALYDTNNRMLEVRQCDEIEWALNTWNPNGKRFFAPEFSATTVRQAASGKVFYIETGSSWSPKEGATAISQ